MSIQSNIEKAAMEIVSSSLVTDNVSGWNINAGLGNDFMNPPLVKIIADKVSTLDGLKELNLGIYKMTLSIVTFGVKALMTPDEFERVSDIVFNPFLEDSICSNLGNKTTNIKVQGAYDMGLNITTLEDGWAATQEIELVVSRIP